MVKNWTAWLTSLLISWAFRWVGCQGRKLWSLIYRIHISSWIYYWSTPNFTTKEGSAPTSPASRPNPMKSVPITNVKAICSVLDQQEMSNTAPSPVPHKSTTKTTIISDSSKTRTTTTATTLRSKTKKAPMVSPKPKRTRPTTTQYHKTSDPPQLNLSKRRKASSSTTNSSR